MNALDIIDKVLALAIVLLFAVASANSIYYISQVNRK